MIPKHPISVSTHVEEHKTKLLWMIPYHKMVFANSKMSQFFVWKWSVSISCSHSYILFTWHIGLLLPYIRIPKSMRVMFICCPSCILIFHGQNAVPNPTSSVTTLPMYPSGCVTVTGLYARHVSSIPVTTKKALPYKNDCYITCLGSTFITNFFHLGCLGSDRPQKKIP